MWSHEVQEIKCVIYEQREIKLATAKMWPLYDNENLFVNHHINLSIIHWVLYKLFSHHN